MKSGVIGAVPTVPRMPSVPKWVLLMEESKACGRRGGEIIGRAGGRSSRSLSAATVARNVVDANDARATLDRENGGDDAGRIDAAALVVRAMRRAPSSRRPASRQRRFA